MTREQAIDHIRSNRDKTFLIRPVSFHQFGIYQITGANTAEVIIEDLTKTEANNILNKGMGYR